MATPHRTDSISRAGLCDAEVAMGTPTRTLLLLMGVLALQVRCAALRAGAAPAGGSRRACVSLGPRRAGREGPEASAPLPTGPAVQGWRARVSARGAHDGGRAAEPRGARAGQPAVAGHGQSRARCGVRVRARRRRRDPRCRSGADERAHARTDRARPTPAGCPWGRAPDLLAGRGRSVATSRGTAATPRRGRRWAPAWRPSLRTRRPRSRATAPRPSSP